jgi:hypothetical protein
MDIHTVEHKDNSMQYRKHYRLLCYIKRKMKGEKRKMQSIFFIVFIVFKALLSHWNIQDKILPLTPLNEHIMQAFFPMENLTHQIVILLACLNVFYRALTCLNTTLLN